MKKTILLLACGIMFQAGRAQEQPKWTAKARKAVFSVITYDKNNQILNTGNGFYISPDGTAVSDYSLFKGAERAVVVTAEGNELPVKYIMGANDIYDVVKFKTETDKKNETLPLAVQAPPQGSTVYLLPYSTQKAATVQSGTVEKVDTISNSSFYYTLNLEITDKTVSCPIMNAEGEVIGMAQKSAGGEGKQSYAIGAGYAASLGINALSANDYTLNSIGIKKGLPEDESQALVYLYVASSQTNRDTYLELLNNFIATYPKNTEGYLRRATCYMDFGDDTHSALAANDMKTLMEVAENKAEAHYNLAKLIYTYRLNLGDKTPYMNWTYEQALQEIDEALAATPEGLYYQVKGDICFAMQNYAGAYEAYQAVNAGKLASAASFYSAAKAKELMEGADKKECIALMDSAVARYNKPYGQEAAPYLYERARLKDETKDYRGAVTDYNEFEQVARGQLSADFYLTRMQAEMNCRMYQQAITDINKAVELEPDNAIYWVEKGGTHLRVNQPEEAVRALEKAIGLDASNAPAYRMLGYCLIQQNQRDKGLSYLQKAKELGDNVAEGLIQKYEKQ